MLYVVNITVPANTPRDKPIEKEIEIKEPILKRISCFFPPGVCCLAGFRVLYGTEQIFPQPKDEYVVGHSETVVGEVYFQLPEVPCKLRIQAFNEDTKYPHTLYIRLETTEQLELAAVRELREIKQLLQQYLEALIGPPVIA